MSAQTTAANLDNLPPLRYVVTGHHLDRLWHAEATDPETAAHERWLAAEAIALSRRDGDSLRSNCTAVGRMYCYSARHVHAAALRVLAGTVKA